MTYKEWIIGKYLCRFPKNSFYSYYDIHGFNKIIRANYMVQKGTPIDVQAQTISYEYNPDGDGTDITEQDIVEFVVKYIKNPFTRKKMPRYSEMDEIEEQYELHPKAFYESI